MPKPVDKSTTYVPALDGLRTIAVIAVVAYHLNPATTPGGLLGVAMFFTLSGYLITANLLRSKYRNGNFGLPGFWLRRFRRLVPAVVITVLAVLLVTLLTTREEIGDRLGEGLSSLAYVNNWFVIIQEKSYFDQFSGPGPLDHMWSLSIEEQFYLAWPLILGVCFLWRRTRLLVSLVVTGVLMVASFSWMAYLAAAHADATRIYEGTDTRAGGLLIGAVVALLLVRKDKVLTLRRGIAEPLGIAGVAGLLALPFLLPDDSPFLFRGGLVVVSLATVAAVLGGMNQKTFISRALGIAPMRWLGERSYGIYLWHLPVTVYLQQFQPKLLHGLVVFAISTALAAMSWTMVEDPIRRHGVIQPLRDWWGTRRQVGTPRILLAAGTVGLVAVATLGVSSALQQPIDGKPKKVNQAMSVPEKPLSKEEEKILPAGLARTTCETVVHVGDSTSIGMFDEDQLPSAKDSAAVRYKKVGVKNVVTSVFGARATAEGWQDYPSAVESVQQLKAEGTAGGKGTCWVIATGVNDAANESVGHSFPFPDRIKQMMDAVGSDRVLWATATTGRDYGPWDIANMRLFNDALRDAQRKYPNLMLYDWAKDAKQQWFLEGDLVHYNATGNAQRAARFADALAQAYPARGKAPASRIVDTSSRKIRISQ